MQLALSMSGLILGVVFAVALHHWRRRSARSRIVQGYLDATAAGFLLGCVVLILPIALGTFESATYERFLQPVFSAAAPAVPGSLGDLLQFSQIRWVFRSIGAVTVICVYLAGAARRLSSTAPHADSASRRYIERVKDLLARPLDDEADTLGFSAIALGLLLHNFWMGVSNRHLLFPANANAGLLLVMASGAAAGVFVIGLLPSDGRFLRLSAASSTVLGVAVLIGAHAEVSGLVVDVLNAAVFAVPILLVYGLGRCLGRAEGAVGLGWKTTLGAAAGAAFRIALVHIV